MARCHMSRAYVDGNRIAITKIKVSSPEIAQSMLVNEMLTSFLIFLSLQVNLISWEVGMITTSAS